MKKSKYSEEQIARILAEAASGSKSIRDVCREHGDTEHTFYWSAPICEDISR